MRAVGQGFKVGTGGASHWGAAGKTEVVKGELESASQRIAGIGLDWHKEMGASVCADDGL